MAAQFGLTSAAKGMLFALVARRRCSAAKSRARRHEAQNSKASGSSSKSLPVASWGALLAAKLGRDKLKSPGRRSRRKSFDIQMLVDFPNSPHLRNIARKTAIPRCLAGAVKTITPNTTFLSRHA